MKKIAAAVLAALLFALPLAGCSSPMKDGAYRAEYKDYDDHGWKDYVEVTVSDGKITGVDYDSIDAQGGLKSADAEYRATMETVTGTYPEKYMKELEDRLLEKQDAKKVDAVTGATTSTDSFKLLASEIIAKGIKKGDTATIVLAQ